MRPVSISRSVHARGRCELLPNSSASPSWTRIRVGQAHHPPTACSSVSSVCSPTSYRLRPPLLQSVRQSSISTRPAKTRYFSPPRTCYYQHAKRNLRSSRGHVHDHTVLHGDVNDGGIRCLVKDIVDEGMEVLDAVGDMEFPFHRGHLSRVSFIQVGIGNRLLAHLSDNSIGWSVGSGTPKSLGLLAHHFCCFGRIFHRVHGSDFAWS
jgi:hypothetical protein